MRSAHPADIAPPPLGKGGPRESLHRRDMLKTVLANLALPFPLTAGLASGEPGDELLLHEVKLVVEIDDQTYRNLWGYLRCITEEELDWRPHPQANSLRWAVGHLNWFEEWVADAIDGTGMYLDDTGGPTSFQERPIALQKERFDAARARLVSHVRGLTPDDLRQEIRFVYNEHYHRRPTTTLHGLLKTHTTHMAGHQYQARYIRGTYSRAHGTEKTCFDPW